VIIVDTSVWVAALRSRSSPEAAQLTSLLDADEVALPVPVRLELLAGASRRDLAPLKRALSALPLLYPTDETWQLVDTWIDRASTAGQRLGITDLVIGALASETGGLVWSLDADFARLRRLRLVQLY
jgi:predicted nucleic acid-binding protein